MSPDDIFAAQFWPWPDPAIKRDAQGRVLFVNAAFLALYGGSVEDWRGNAVGGWTAPQAGGAPFRFETRMPSVDGSEQVYDWMEQILADGNAFALARNVTVFTQAPDPKPSESIVPQTQFQAQSQVPQAAATAAPQGAPVLENQMDLQASQVPEMAPTIEAEAPMAAPAIEAPMAAPEIEAPVFAAEPMFPAAPVAEIAAPVAEMLAPEIPEISIQSNETYALTEAAPALPPIEEPVRDFERRALPIEDESAVLGNNWRDAVIAKAVGASSVAENVNANANAQPTNEADSQAEPSSDGSTIRILLAEDNAINALLTRTLLEADGHTVDTVEDGQLAVEAMKTSTYDLIFMDMRMPNMDGLEATRKIRTLPNVGKNLPIIALTANAFDDDRNACFDSGMNDFMTKPVSAEELSEKVRDWTSPEAKARIANAA